MSRKPRPSPPACPRRGAAPACADRVAPAGPHHHGLRTSEFYLILEGHVRAELHSPSGREVILGDLGPSELLGEFAALDDPPRSATVEATTPCVLACFPAAMFRAAVFAHPETAAWMARQL